MPRAAHLPRDAHLPRGVEPSRDAKPPRAADLPRNPPAPAAPPTGWIDRISLAIGAQRGPQAGDLALTRHRVYILPTRAGLLFGGVLLTMLLTAINYSLSLGYALTFLLAGVGLVSMLHTWRNLVGLTLRAGRADPVHAGELADLGLLVHNPGTLERFAIELTVPGTAQPQRVDVAPRAEQMVGIALPTTRRGWMAVPRIKLATTFPLGLWRAWAWWHPSTRVLVLPRLETPAAPLPAASALSGDVASGGQGEEDFAAIRPWRSGDARNRIAWKAMARTDSETLLTKQFEGGFSGELWLDWRALPAGLDPEDRLSRLARWVCDADAIGARYGLWMPGRTLETDAGAAHRAACLEALALAGA